MSSYKLVSWNVNGIRAVHRKKVFLDLFESLDFDILCIQETKANIDQLPAKLLNIKGYECFFNSAEKKGYSGVAIYTSKPIKNLNTKLGVEKFDSEGRVLQADFDDFILFNIYFPNGGMSDERLQYKLEFYDTFLDYVNDLRDAGNNIIVCGDFNTAHKEIDLYHPKENTDKSGFLPIEREWMTKFIENGYTDTFREFNKEPHQYTWWSYRTKARTRNVGWRLDYFFTNDNFMKKVKNSYILSDIEGSDHCPIALEIEL